MNTSDSAEAIVRMTLEGVEVAARITGAGAKELAVMLYTMHKDQKMTKGKTNLSNMLKTGKPLKIFSIKQEDLKRFHQEAKRYGVLYTALTDKKNKDGMVDIYVREEDALKVNRIVDKFKLSVVDRAGIQSEIQKDKIEEMLKDAKERGVEVKSAEERLADEIMSKPIQKEGNENSNPDVAKTEKSPQSEPSSENKKNLGVTSKPKKKSVRELLKEIKREIDYANADEHTKQSLREGREVHVYGTGITGKGNKVYQPRARDLKKLDKGKSR